MCCGPAMQPPRFNAWFSLPLLPQSSVGATWAAPTVLTPLSTRSPIQLASKRGKGGNHTSCGTTPPRGCVSVCVHPQFLCVAFTFVPFTDDSKVKKGYIFTEKDWNESSSLENHPYRYSKVRAERAVWDFVKQEKPSVGSVLDAVCALLSSYVTGEPCDSFQLFLMSVSQLVGWVLGLCHSSV